MSGSMPCGGGSDGRWAITVTGLGGQGTVLAAQILATAAVAAGKWACQTAVYTVAARGGFSSGEVLVAPRPLACPLAEELDVIVALSELGWTTEAPRLAAGGLAICEDSLRITLPHGARLLRLPLEALAREAGSPRSANLAGLGALVAVTGLLPADAVLQAISGHLPGLAGTGAAFWAGFRAAEAGAIREG
jgi:2-oxoglutarate ferredoxin oxidoreductase subunit gamma